MTSEQAAKTKAIDREIHAEHAASLKYLDPKIDPNVPVIVKLFDTAWGM